MQATGEDDERRSEQVGKPTDGRINAIVDAFVAENVKKEWQEI